MSSVDVIESVLRSDLITRGPTSDPQSLGAAGLRLHASHRRLLERCDGLTAYGGFFRVFRVSPASGPSLPAWNEVSTWKFAWPSHVRDYLCFGETAFGDQYAFRFDELDESSSSPVYLLEALTLRPEPLARNLEDFLVNELLRNAAAPYDEMIRAARAAVGDLSTDEHVTYSPSPLLTGEESLQNIVKMPSIAAMILNGDLATQLSDNRRTGSVAGVELFDDELGRSRIKVTWIETPHPPRSGQE